MDTKQPHAYRGITGAGIDNRCLHGLSREHGGISCGKPQDDPIHHLLDRDGSPLAAGDRVQYVGTLRHLDGLQGVVDDAYGGAVMVMWDDHDDRRPHSPDALLRVQG